MTERRPYRIAVWDSQKKFIDRDKAKLEFYLQKVVEPQFVPVNSLEQLAEQSFDLLLAVCHHLDEEGFAKWIPKICQSMENNFIWTPALIVRNVQFDEIEQFYDLACDSNWYFDVISPEHFDGLPLRIANLLRIHDHLKELHRYDQELSKLRAQAGSLETELKELKAKE